MPVVDPRPWPTGYNFGFGNDGGVLTLLPGPATNAYPIKPNGLPPGAVWNTGMAIGVIPGVLPSPLFPAVYFGGEIDATQLLRIGGGNLPLKNPTVATQLWNNGGLVCVS